MIVWTITRVTESFVPVSAVSFTIRVGTPGVGVPDGGATGAVLRKASADDYDTEWGVVTAASITDSTATGRAVLTAASAAAARSAISAGDALTTGTLGQFAATTSAQLAGVLTDETGSGSAVFSASPTLTTPSISGTLAVYQTGQSGASTARVDVSHDGTFGNITNRNSTAGFFFNDASGRATYFARNAIRNSVNSVISWTPNDGDTAPDVGLARLDSNTVEVNNGTRTASGGAPRGLSVSTLTASGQVIARQAGGTAGTDEVQVYHDGTRGWIESKDGPMRIMVPGTFATLQLSSGTGAFPTLTNVVHGTADGGYLRFENAMVLGRITDTMRVDFQLVTLNGLLSLATYTVATLPSASANAGRLAQVTDSNTTTNGSTVAGGGANRVPVFSNGTNWIVK